MLEFFRNITSAIRHGTNIRELSMSSQRRARRPARKESATS